MSEVLYPIAGYHDSHTPIDICDLWQIPPEIFVALNHEFRFVADGAASKLNYLLPTYLTEQ